MTAQAVFEDEASGYAGVNRPMVTASVMLGTIITSLDTTIANVALPHIAGTVSASQDQITWVLTSYIIAAAIVTPTSGWLAGRIGRKRMFLICVTGFTFASALCGAAQTLAEIVIFRLLQGAFGACLLPLSQSVTLDLYPLEQRGRSQAIFGMAVMAVPIIGPVLGGWLTEDFTWRWVFYINLPIGILSILGVMTFLPERKRRNQVRFDGLGFGLISIALASFQLCLDRGQNQGWFDSPEIVIEASVAAVAIILFAIHIATVEHPFLPLELLADRNFVAATILALTVGLLVFAAMALLPPMIQGLLGYPVAAAGIVMAPRGVGAMISIFVAGRLVGKVDNRILILCGLSFFAVAFYRMSQFSLLMDATEMTSTGFIQGLGAGFVFMPSTILAYATIRSAVRPDATGFFTLARNLGNSAGVAVMQAIFSRNVQTVHARLTEGLASDNPVTRTALTAAESLTSPNGVAALNGEVTRQASMVAYVDVFHLMFLTTIAVAPLILFLRRPRRVVLEIDPPEID